MLTSFLGRGSFGTIRKVRRISDGYVRCGLGDLEILMAVNGVSC